MTFHAPDTAATRTHRLPSSAPADARVNAQPAPATQRPDPPLSDATRRERFLLKIREIRRKSRGLGGGGSTP